MADRETVIAGLIRVWDAFDAMEHELYADYVFDALELLKEQGYREWMIEMFHKYGRDDLIAFMVLKGEEKLLAGLLKEQTQIVCCKDCKYYTEPDHGDRCEKIHWSRGDDWFCADGKVKDINETDIR